MAHVQDMGEGCGADASGVRWEGHTRRADRLVGMGGMERAQLSTGRPKVAQSREISAWGHTGHRKKGRIVSTWITSATGRQRRSVCTQ